MASFGTGAREHAADEARDEGRGRRRRGEVQDAPEGDEVGRMGVVLDVADGAVREVGGVCVRVSSVRASYWGWPERGGEAGSGGTYEARWWSWLSGGQTRLFRDACC